MNAFKKDPFHFIKYFLLNAGIFGGLCLFMIFGVSQSWELNLSGPYFWFIPLGIVIGLISATAFHNASRGNIHPKALNTLIGELTADFTLEDIRCFRVGHMLHHIHADDPELDPHPPTGLTFTQFIRQSRQRTIDCIAKLYFRSHGNTPQAQRNVRVQIALFHVAALAKLAFWLLFFGPTKFVFFFLPAYLTYFFSFAHLNYISHLGDESGETMHNHSEGWYYRVMNIITSGGYYHKNHHLAPKLYNPSKLKGRAALPATAQSLPHAH